MPTPRRFLSACLATLVCLSAHSALAESPQRIEGLGTITFPTSTSSTEAQTAFVRGVLLLHVFEYEQAEQAFLEAQKIDPAFAMAYWGEAMTVTHPVWNQTDVTRGRAALAKLGVDASARAAKISSAREKGYFVAIEALYGDGEKQRRDENYLAAMKQLVSDFPDDDEARSFYALALLGISQGQRNIPNYLQAAEIAKAIYGRNTDHPGAAHYWIHGMDDPEHAAGALIAANALAKIAPDAGHAQHMTAHIFLALGMWPDVVTANQNGIRVVDEENKTRQQPSPTCGHYAEWLEYAYFQQGRQHEAQRLLINCRQLAPLAVTWLAAHPERQAEIHRTPEMFDKRLRSSLIAMRATSLSESSTLRGDTLAMDLNLKGLGRDVGWAAFSRGVALVAQGELSRAKKALAELERIVGQPAEKGEDANTAAFLHIMKQTLDAALHHANGDSEKAVTLLAQASAQYDALPIDFGPPVISKPPHELAGEILLAMKQPARALTEFDLCLKAMPQRALSLLGRARALLAMGEAEQAHAAYGQLLEVWENADADLPALAEVRAAAL